MAFGGNKAKPAREPKHFPREHYLNFMAGRDGRFALQDLGFSFAPPAVCSRNHPPVTPPTLATTRPARTPPTMEDLKENSTRDFVAENCSEWQPVLGRSVLILQAYLC